MITLLGHGYIGTSIAKELKKQKKVFNWISHTDSIPFETKVIINAAGYTGSPNVDACELHKQETIDGNVVFPYKLELSNPDIPIIHISSGCVYTGYKVNGWTEEDPPNFDFNNGSFYSGSKALGQEILMPFMNKSYLFRIRMPFGNTKHPKNILTKLSKYEKLIDYRNSFSYVDDIAQACIYFATYFPQPGIYNLCNPGSMTTKQIADMLGLKKSWFTEKEFKDAVVAPRSNCEVNTEKLCSVFPLQPIEEAMLEAIKIYKK